MYLKIDIQVDWDNLFSSAGVFFLCKPVMQSISFRCDA